MIELYWGFFLSKYMIFELLEVIIMSRYIHKFSEEEILEVVKVLLYG